MRKKITFVLHTQEAKTLLERVGSVTVRELTSIEDAVALHQLREALEGATVVQGLDFGADASV